jgi:hypothetical protein
LATVTDLDRRLVKAHLRPVGGRGPNAAKMTPLEAARLLAAVLASPQSNEAAQAVLRYEQTRVDKARSSEGLLGVNGLEDLAALPPRHGFVDGLAALIASAGRGSLARMIAGVKGAKGTRLEVFAFTQMTLGRIRISGLPNGVIASVEYLPAPPKGTAAKGRNRTPGDLEQSRRITEQTILSVARLFTE